MQKINNEIYLKEQCVCGKTHYLETQKIVVNNRAFNELLKRINELDQKNILILNSYNQAFFIENIKQKCIGKNISIISILNTNPTIYFASHIEDKGQDIVIAIGDDNLISIAKYYAFSFNIPLIVFTKDNYFDWTFSKFARLFDGVSFNFYITNQPSEIYVYANQKKIDDYQLQYLASKFIAIFDNKLSDLLFEQNSCPKMQDFLKKTMLKFIKQYDKTKDKNSLIIWTLIRLGQAMSYFDNCKFFFGGDRAISEMICCLKPSFNYLEINVISIRLVLDSYGNFLKKNSFKTNVNLNLHIDKISKNLKISVTEVLNRLITEEYLNISNKRIELFEGYKPYLFNLFTKLSKNVLYLQSQILSNEKILKKYNVKANIIRKSFASSPCFYNKMSLLHVMFNYGYLDKFLSIN